MKTYLLIIGERRALAWVVEHERMAFAANRASSALQLAVGDELLLYTTRGAFHNPTRDRGRIMGSATVASEVQPFDQPIQVAGREFTHGCDIEILSLAPYRQGVDLADRVAELDVFPDPASWSARMRTTLLPLGRSDATRLRRALRSVAEDPRLHRVEYAQSPGVAAWR